MIAAPVSHAWFGLSEEQTKKAKNILFQVMKTNIKQRADLQIAELDLQELLEAEPVDMGQVEAKLKGIEGLHTTLRLNMIKAHEQAKAMLTPEQRQTFERLHDHFVGIITPDKPRVDGKLAVQITLETHTVDLNPYHPETLALLRDAPGPRGTGCGPRIAEWERSSSRRHIDLSQHGCQRETAVGS